MESRELWWQLHLPHAISPRRPLLSLIFSSLSVGSDTVHALVQTEAASHRHWKRDRQVPIIIPIEYFAVLLPFPFMCTHLCPPLARSLCHCHCFPFSFPAVISILTRYDDGLWYSSVVDGANSVLFSSLLIFHLVPFTAVTLFTRPIKMFSLLYNSVRSFTREIACMWHVCYNAFSLLLDQRGVSMAVVLGHCRQSEY